MNSLNHKIIQTFNLENLVTSIRDFNGIKIALYKTEDDGAAVINQTPEGDWIFSKSITVNDVIKSPPWIDNEDLDV